MLTMYFAYGDCVVGCVFSNKTTNANAVTVNKSKPEKNHSEVECWCVSFWWGSTLHPCHGDSLFGIGIANVCAFWCDDVCCIALPKPGYRQLKRTRFTPLAGGEAADKCKPWGTICEYS